jgi:hypothetical protein
MFASLRAVDAALYITVREKYEWASGLALTGSLVITVFLPTQAIKDLSAFFFGWSTVTR